MLTLIYAKSKNTFLLWHDLSIPTNSFRINYWIMKEKENWSTIEVIQNGSVHSKKSYTILVPIQNRKQFDLLLPAAIDMATKHHGKVFLLNIIEIPYQLPPSAARKFILERELLLMPGMEMLKRAGCRGITTIRIAHHTGNAIERFAEYENVNIIVKEYDQVVGSNAIFDWLRESLKSLL